MSDSTNLSFAQGNLLRRPTDHLQLPVDEDEGDCAREELLTVHCKRFIAPSIEALLKLLNVCAKSCLDTTTATTTTNN